MSDNIHPEIVELRHRVMVLESELARVDPNRGVDRIIPLTRVNRIDVVDSQGRAYTRRVPNADISLSVQDGGKTLKVFIDQRWKD